MDPIIRINTVIHRLRLARRIVELLKSNAASRLLHAAWRVFVRLAQATQMSPQQALAQVS